MDFRVAFIDLDNDQIGQGYEEKFSKNALGDLTAISITPVYPGETEEFVNKWNPSERIQNIYIEDQAISIPLNDWIIPSSRYP